MGESIAALGYLAGICGHDGDDWLKVLIDADGKLIIEVDTSALPSGAATSANQLTMITALQSLQNLVGALHDVGLDELDIIFAGQDADVEVIQTTPADLVVAQHQYDGSAWRKSNLLWGFHDTVSELVSDTDLSAGTQVVLGAQVPSGEVWVITNCAASVTSGTATEVGLFSVVDSINVPIRIVTNPTSGLWYAEVGTYVLAEDDRMRARIVNATALDDLHLVYAGYKMDINM